MMSGIGEDGLRAVAAGARDAVARAARGAGRGDEAAMAATARAAIFQEALLGALRSRYAALKSVAR